ncbi:MAG: extracellular solute-binding protein [Chloroflexi bacterium]|nr:extracellular solute-binding protein [Chloroflexota bacterium]
MSGRFKLFKVTATMTVMLLFAVLFPPPAALSKDTMTIWCSLDSSEARVLNDLVSEYNKSNPGTIFTVRNFDNPDILWRDLMTGEEMPNVALIPVEWQLGLIRAGRIVPIQTQLEKVSGTVAVMARMDTFKPLIEACTENGVLWTLPLCARPYALIGDSDRLEAVNMDKIASWGDMIKWGRKLQENGAKNVFYLPVNGSPEDMGLLFEIMLWHGGGDLYDPSTRQVLFDSPKGVKTLAFLQDLVFKYGIANSGSASPEKSVFYTGTIKDMLQLESEGKRVRIVRFPVLPNSGATRNRTPFECLTLALFKNNNRDVEKAYHMAYYLREFKSSLKWILRTPYLPAHKQVTMNPEFFQYMSVHPGVKDFLVAMEISRPSYNDPAYFEVLKIIGAEVQKALKNPGATPESALRAAKAKCEPVLQRLR